MMADAVEASSRVLNDPTPARISALVDKIINHIFLDGQLDECELTLKDISEVRNASHTYSPASSTRG
jgi:membrane-associated HD superfamily phosphohydrolase